MTTIRRSRFKSTPITPEAKFTKGNRVLYEIDGESRCGTIVLVQKSGDEFRYLVDCDDDNGSLYRSEKQLTRLADKSSNHGDRRAQSKGRSTNTGDSAFDTNRFKAKGMNHKKRKGPMGSPLALVGDVVDNIFSNIFSPDTLITICYTLAGASLTVSAYGWHQLLGGSQWYMALVGALAAVIEQAIEIYPRLPTYFPEFADKLTYKLSTQKFINPPSSGNSPSLLDESKNWARTADEKLHNLASAASNVMYLLALGGALMSFQVIDYKTWTFDSRGLIWVVIAVAAFEAFLFAAQYFKLFKLSFRQSRQYKEQGQRNRLAAEKVVHQQKNG
jgi:hypothetical protein